MRAKGSGGTLLHIAAEGGSTNMLMAVHDALEKALGPNAVCVTPFLNRMAPSCDKFGGNSCYLDYLKFNSAKVGRCGNLHEKRQARACLRTHPPALALLVNLNPHYLNISLPPGTFNTDQNTEVFNFHLFPFVLLRLKGFEISFCIGDISEYISVLEI